MQAGIAVKSCHKQPALRCHERHQLGFKTESIIRRVGLDRLDYLFLSVTTRVNGMLFVAVEVAYKERMIALKMGQQKRPPRPT